MNELEDTIETVIKLMRAEKDSGKKDELGETSTVTKETQETLLKKQMNEYLYPT